MASLSYLRAASKGAPKTMLKEKVEVVTKYAQPLPSLDDPAFASHFDRLGKAKIVLLGEATHGTHEFYQARALITEYLVKNHGFNIVAVEADWPDAKRIDGYIRRLDTSELKGLTPFKRFPTWMWRNQEITEFIHRLRDINTSIDDPNRRVGFYGLDLYSLAESIEAVLKYLDAVDPDAAKEARERYSCLNRFKKDPTRYEVTPSMKNCEKEIVEQLVDLMQKRVEYESLSDPEGYFSAERNASLIINAEKYYRAAFYGGPSSWNLRDHHMFETLQAVLAQRGPNAKAVVWAHNSHLGDASQTYMKEQGEINLGQLAREKFHTQCINLGFGTNTGTVIAASNWGAKWEVKTVQIARDDSYEGVFRRVNLPRFLLDFKAPTNSELIEVLKEPMLERAIGVIYRPETELYSHYFLAVLPKQFDFYVWFSTTSALKPHSVPNVKSEEPETWPFAL